MDYVSQIEMIVLLWWEFLKIRPIWRYPENTREKVDSKIPNKIDSGRMVNIHLC